jgi:L-ascorbate metabolism protein UlaG (beta-lactamase superfamily)
MTTTRITHIGGPAALIEVGEWRLLTDPTFDPPGRRYSFGWAPLPGAGMVLTTAAGARRLGGNARGLQPWATTQLEAPARPPIHVTATPAATAHR